MPASPAAIACSTWRAWLSVNGWQADVPIRDLEPMAELWMLISEREGVRRPCNRVEHRHVKRTQVQHELVAWSS